MRGLKVFFRDRIALMNRFNALGIAEIARVVSSQWLTVKSHLTREIRNNAHLASGALGFLDGC